MEGRAAMIPSNHHKRFGKALESFDYSRRTYEKFYEFCKVSAYSLASVFYPQFAKEQLASIKLIEDKEKLTAYQECFDILVEALESEHQDFLGNFFEINGLGNDRRGQFFTPYPISLLCAKMQISGHNEIIEKRGFIKVCEPACGAGGMIIAVREVLLDNGYNPSMNMYAELMDIDELCFYMAYIQISLYGIAAKVIHGDTLRMKIFQELFTPVYFINKFSLRMALTEMSDMLICTPDENLHEEKIQMIVPDPILEDCGQYRLAL
jgi:hypothetical protein